MNALEILLKIFFSVVCEDLQNTAKKVIKDQKIGCTLYWQ